MGKRLRFLMLAWLVSIPAHAAAWEFAAILDLDAIKDEAGRYENSTSFGYLLSHELHSVSMEDLGLVIVALESEGFHTLEESFGVEVGTLVELWFEPKWAIGLKPILCYSQDDRAITPVLEGSLRWKGWENLSLLIEVGHDVLLAQNASVGTFKMEAGIGDRSLVEIGYSKELSAPDNEMARIRLGYVF